jgi:hypothetical protein
VLERDEGKSGAGRGQLQVLAKGFAGGMLALFFVVLRSAVDEVAVR